MKTLLLTDCTVLDIKDPEVNLEYFTENTKVTGKATQGLHDRLNGPVPETASVPGSSPSFGTDVLHPCRGHYSL